MRPIGKLIVGILSVAVAVFPVTAAQARMPSTGHAGHAHVHVVPVAGEHHHAHSGHQADVAADLQASHDGFAHDAGSHHDDKACCLACHAADVLLVSAIEPPSTRAAMIRLAGDPQISGLPPSGIERPPKSL